MTRLVLTALLCLWSPAVLPSLALADTANTQVGLKVVSAKLEPDGPEDDYFAIRLRVKTTNKTGEDYCQLSEKIHGRISGAPYVFVYSRDGTQLYSNFEPPRLTGAIWESDEWYVVRYRNKAEVEEEYLFWSDYLPESKASLLDMKMSVGRALFPCSEAEANGIDREVNTSAGESRSKVNELLFLAGKGLVTSPRLQITSGR